MDKSIKIANSGENLVPFQSLSLLHQRKCIAFFGDPYEIQQKENLEAYKIQQETDIGVTPCKVEYPLQLPRKIMRALCQTCTQVQTASALLQSANFHLNENTQGLKCLCNWIAQMNERRKGMGAQPISHNQVYKWMQYV